MSIRLSVREQRVPARAAKTLLSAMRFSSVTLTLFFVVVFFTVRWAVEFFGAGENSIRYRVRIDVVTKNKNFSH